MSKTYEAILEIKSRLAMDFNAAVRAAGNALTNLPTLLSKSFEAVGNPIAKALGVDHLSGLTSIFGILSGDAEKAKKSIEDVAGAVGNLASGSLDKAEAFDRRISALAGTLRATGQGGREAAKELGKWAQTFAVASGNTADEVAAALEFAAANDVVASQLQQTVRQANALAAAYGGNLANATAKLVALKNGEAAGIREMVPELRNMADANATANGLLAMMPRLLGAAREKSGGLAGALNAVRESADGAQRAIGEKMGEAVQSAVPHTDGLTISMREAAATGEKTLHVLRDTGKGFAAAGDAAGKAAKDAAAAGKADPGKGIASVGKAADAAAKDIKAADKADEDFFNKHAKRSAAFSDMASIARQVQLTFLQAAPAVVSPSMPKGISEAGAAAGPAAGGKAGGQPGGSLGVILSPEAMALLRAIAGNTGGNLGIAAAEAGAPNYKATRG
jgi:hypothetical protein